MTCTEIANASFLWITIHLYLAAIFEMIAPKNIDRSFTGRLSAWVLWPALISIVPIFLWILFRKNERDIYIYYRLLFKELFR